MDHTMNDKGKVSTNPPAQSLAPSRAQSGTAACPTTLSLQPVGTLGPHKPLPSLKTSQFGRPQPHVRSSEQVPPPVLPLLPQHHKGYLFHSYFCWEPWGSGSAASLGTDTSKHGIQQWHSGHGHNSWNDSHICLCPEQKGLSAPFLPGTQTPAEGKTYQAGKLWHGACTNMVNIKEE